MNTKNSRRVDSKMVESGRIKNQIARAAESTDDVVKATIDAIIEILTKIINNNSHEPPLADVIANVAGGAIRGIIQVGADPRSASAGIMIGIVRGTQDTGVATLETIRRTAHMTVRDTLEVEGDIEAVTAGLVSGAITCAKELGVSFEAAASAVADGALRAAGEVGSSAVLAVSTAVTKSSAESKRRVNLAAV